MVLLTTLPWRSIHDQPHRPGSQTLVTTPSASKSAVANGQTVLVREGRYRFFPNTAPVGKRFVGGSSFQKDTRTIRYITLLKPRLLTSIVKACSVRVW
jgi:hypothetical protein